MLHDLLKPTLDKEPDRRIIEFYGEQYTARELEMAALKLVSRLKLAGQEAIDRVAMLLPNCPEAVEIYLACFKGGLCCGPFRLSTPVTSNSLCLKS